MKINIYEKCMYTRDMNKTNKNVNYCIAWLRIRVRWPPDRDTRGRYAIHDWLKSRRSQQFGAPQPISNALLWATTRAQSIARRLHVCCARVFPCLFAYELAYIAYRRVRSTGAYFCQTICSSMVLQGPASQQDIWHVAPRLTARITSQQLTKQ